MIISYSSVVLHLLNNYKKFLYNLLYKKISFSIISLKKKKKKTFLKSPHVNKKAKENFTYTLYSFKLILPFSFLLLKTLKYNVPKSIRLKFKILTKV